jgi:hypothetical protein
MYNLNRYFTLITIICIISVSAAAENTRPVLFKEIISDITAYKNKTISMKLKLKNIDTIFEKITFYDPKNIDIEFDFSSKELQKKLQNDFLNLHEGMDYIVVFIVKDEGNLGRIIADLESFKPAILEKLP